MRDLTTDLRALSVTSLEYYNLDTLGRKGDNVRKVIRDKRCDIRRQCLPSLTMMV
jgi:hypothetical protein